MTETAEAEILQLIKYPATRDKGFIQLMDRYKEPVYWHVRRLVVSHEDAEDILQETFIQVYRYLDSFKGESRIFTWLYRIATNECTKHFRKNKKWRNNGGNKEVVNEPSVTDSEEGDAILIKFQRAILQLPEKQRIVFNLRYYDELSYEDIARILQSSVSSLKTNYHYASEKVKQYMIDHA